MKHALWLILLPVIVAGCLGRGSGHASSNGASAGGLPLTESSPPVHIPLTDLRVSYPVGDIAMVRSHLASCPSGATCRDVRLRTSCESVAPCPARPWFRVAHRRLTCSPSGGDYSDPKAACAALGDLDQLRLGNAASCYCAFVPRYEPPRATGNYNGHRLILPLDPCSLCGLGAQAAHDAAVLMPQT
jgi:hypothetical protein